jgi:hypothetical protein
MMERFILDCRDGELGRFNSYCELLEAAREYLEAGFRGVTAVDNFGVCSPRPLVLKNGRVF